jgi:hypothetical protein
MADNATPAEANTDTAETSVTDPAAADGDKGKTATEGDKHATILAGKTADENEGAAKSKDADSDKEASETEEAEGISYDDITIPKGMEVDEAALGSFKALAAKMNDGKGLSKDDAQAIVDFRAELIKGQVEQWEKTFSEWRGEIHADKNIGGDNFVTTTIPNVLAAAERYGGPEMVTLLKTDKVYGENPTLIRFLNRVGETLAEDKLARGNPASPSKDAAETLYGKK